MNSSGILTLNDTLYQLFGASSWQDIRHCKTLIWMVIGLIGSGCIRLSSWADHTHRRAKQAASRVRRFARWLANDKVEATGSLATSETLLVARPC